MYDALSSLATATTWQPTVDRFAHILAYAHAHDIGHPQPDVYANEHWRRELRAAREMFFALTCPVLQESAAFRRMVIVATDARYKSRIVGRDAHYFSHVTQGDDEYFYVNGKEIVITAKIKRDIAAIFQRYLFSR